MYGSKYCLLWPCTIKHDFYFIKWTFTGFTYGPTYFCSELDSIRFIYDIDRVELTRTCGVDFMCGCIYGLTPSLTVSHGLVRSRMIIHGHGARVSFFLKF